MHVISRLRKSQLYLATDELRMLFWVMDRTERSCLSKPNSVDINTIQWKIYWKTGDHYWSKRACDEKCGMLFR